MFDDIKAIDQVITDQYAIYHGDSCELMRAIPGDSLDYGIHSPPFEGLYKFSNSERDISNNEGGGFWQHYGFLISELLRTTKPGRLHSVHCMQLPTSKTRHGFIGMRDFRGEIVRAYEDAGWIFHSEVCIWKDPVVAQQRTKSLRLLHKQIVKDSSMSGQGLADYIVTFRKPGENETAIAGMFDHYVGAEPDASVDQPGWSEARSSHGIDVSRENYERHAAETVADGRTPWTFEQWRSVLIWQRYASPVWMDIKQTNTLQYRNARDEADEAHISPLQLDVIERCIQLWSLPGEVVFTPFLGIGSEAWAAARMGRKGMGIELKASYFEQAKRNMLDLKLDSGVTLFDETEDTE